MDPLTHALKNFLSKYADPMRPMLLGLSGGPDSLCLFHLLEQLQVPFGVAHLDHGWRKESAEEAEALKGVVESRKIPFHLKSLELCSEGENLENAGRKQRFAYFRELCDRFGYQAVILGHHANDQAETVMKRVFEGANLLRCGGMREISNIHGVAVWRPLLKIPKYQILNWVREKGLSFFEDPSNHSDENLRGRMRQKLFPAIEEAFGKRIAGNLCELGDQISLLEDYFHARLGPVLANLDRQPWGVFLDLSGMDVHPVEYRQLVLKVCGQEGCALSRGQLASVVAMLQAGRANKRFPLGSQTLIVDRKRLFLISEEKNCVNQSMKISNDQGVWGDWSYQLTRESGGQSQRFGWHEAWKGVLSISLPMGEYAFESPATAEASQFRKLWNDRKVPAFLRDTTPILKRKGGALIELLTHEREKMHQDLDAHLRLTLIRREKLSKT